MILILHIIIALSGLFYTAYVFFYPSKIKLNVTYGLVALTFLSGFYLIMTRPVHMVQTCTTGLIYLGIMLAGIFAARHKLARAVVKNQGTDFQA